MIGKYDFKEVELGVLKFWKDNDIYKKAKDRNKAKKEFYFLDGPPYTSGKVHIGTAWNKALKDMVLRGKRMHGYDVWDRAGYDMHGLPVERQIMEKLGQKYKEDTEKYGVDKFVQQCQEFAVKNLKLMNDDFKRIGVWMDFDDAYMSISPSFIDGEWWLIKKAHQKKRLYEGFRTVHWCKDCATGLAKHELEYQNVNETSIFVKMPVRGKKDEYFIIWTTTPWTIPINIAIMVNPDYDYVKCDVDGEKWWVAKALAGAFIQGVANKKLKIIEEVKGEKLAGTKYTSPFFDDIPELKKIDKKSKNAFTIILSKEYVDTTAGTGLVHNATGGGPEDYEVGHSYGIPPFNYLDQYGIAPDNVGVLSGFEAKKDDHKIVDELRKRKLLIDTTEVEHDYPHCWRCKQPVIFRTTKQWFFKVEDLKEKMIKLNNKIKWVPEAAFNAFDSWLKNLRDNSITKQRYWGTPLPVWKCNKCKDYVVVGSIKELEKLSKQKVENPHKPWIDEITIECKKCKKDMKRIPDILDVWVDAGTTSWNCLDYPAKKDLFKKYFPADFILEGKDQIRGWFNLLHVASVVSMGKPCFKNCYMHGFIQDSQGRKMSKSAGNHITPDEIIDKHGADTLRFYMIGGANAGVDLNYNFEDMKIKFKNLDILWNLHKYLIDYSNNAGINPIKLDPKKIGDEERFMLSKLNSGIREVTHMFEEYRLDEIPWVIEEVILELSRTYIQLVRDKLSVGTEDEKRVVLYTIWTVLYESIKMLAIVCPFITEAIYQNFKKEFGLKEESVHFFDWPRCDETMINKEIEEDFAVYSGVVQAVLYTREKCQLGVRWPVKEVVVVTEDKGVRRSVEKVDSLIKVQTNVKEIVVKDRVDFVNLSVRADFKQMGPDFGALAPKIIAKMNNDSPNTILKSIEKEGKFVVEVDGKKCNIVKEHLIVQRDVKDPYVENSMKGGFVYLNKDRNEELEAEGYAREIMRLVQSLRKDSGLQKADRISLFIKVDSELDDMLKGWEKQIKEKVGAKQMMISSKDPSKKHKFDTTKKIKGKSISVMFDLVT